MNLTMITAAACLALTAPPFGLDYDFAANGRMHAESVVVGRITKAHAAPVDAPWMWTLAFWHHEDRTPTHGYAPTREAAMAAFAKSWRRE